MCDNNIDDVNDVDNEFDDTDANVVVGETNDETLFAPLEVDSSFSNKPFQIGYDNNDHNDESSSLHFGCDSSCSDCSGSCWLTCSGSCNYSYSRSMN